MSQLLTLLNEMRGRQGMYLGSPSIIKLAAFLRGFDHAVEKHGNGKSDPFLSEFRDWVQRRYATNNRSWEEVILAHSNNEAQAVDQFWLLFDEFLKMKEDHEHDF